MKALQLFTDKMAIGLSLLCAAHCLILPLMVVLLPSLAAMGLENEAFHRWMLAAVIPTSLFAFAIGYKRHQQNRFLVLGALGVLLLILAVVLEDAGELYEKAFTLIGASFLVYGHYQNYQLCRVLDKSKRLTEQEGQNNAA